MAAHATFVSDMLDDAEIGAPFATADRLPPGYGVGFDERVVEYPWLFAQQVEGRVLDAGSTLNHAHILDRFLPRVDALHIVTLAPEAWAFTERGVSYLFADLRDLPFRDGLYDTVVSISTLEHVGMDNTLYGHPRGNADHPEQGLRRAVAELRRVARAGGRLLVTVPYGRPEDHGWLRQFDAAELAKLVDSMGPAQVAVTVYAYSDLGWQLSSPELAADAAYQPPFGPAVADDGAVAARAVACIAAKLEF